MPTLINTVKSFMNQDVYGVAGEPVLIVVERGNVVIVESLTGNRFPTLKTNITEEVVEVKPVEKAPALPGRKTKASKPKVQTSNTLF